MIPDKMHIEWDFEALKPATIIEWTNKETSYYGRLIYDKDRNTIKVFYREMNRERNSMGNFEMSAEFMKEVEVDWLEVLTDNAIEGRKRLEE